MSATQDHEQAGLSGADVYALSRGETASIRLNAQQYLFKDTLGFNIHPSLLTGDERASLRVTDIGTGRSTSIVSTQAYKLTDSISQQTSIHRETGFLVLYPCIGSTCSNRSQSINVRLFMLVGAAGNLRQVLRNLMTMLRPGGHLQWIEHDPYEAEIIRANPSVRSNSSEATLGQIQSFRDFSWVSNLESILQELDFVDVSAKSYSVPHELQMYWQQVILRAAEDVTYVTTDNSASNGQGPKFRLLTHEAIIEMKSACRIIWNPIVFVGRRMEQA